MALDTATRRKSWTEWRHLIYHIYNLENASRTHRHSDAATVSTEIALATFIARRRGEKDFDPFQARGY